MKNKIFLKRKNKVIVELGDNNLSDIYIGTMLKNIESLGYTFSRNLIKALKTLEIEDLVDFNLRLVTDIKELIGADVIYKPMYPNFPEQVMTACDAELLINAVIHYVTFGKLLPKYEYKERFPLLDKCELKIIDLGTEAEFIKIFTNLFNSKTSISQEDKEDMKYFISEYKDKIDLYLPKEIPLKENVAYVSKIIFENINNSEVIFRKYFKSATDVLRFAAVLSDGDASLAENTKFKKFKRKERRLLLRLLEHCENIEEDMAKYKNQWIRLGEILHPAEYTFYEKSKESFDKIRNNKRIETINGKIATLAINKKHKELIKLLKKRPSEFARKLDYLLRICPKYTRVTNEFEKVSNEVSTAVLLQVMTHFKHRNEKRDVRIFFPKGNLAKVHVEDNDLKVIDKEICDIVVKICEESLIRRFKERKPLGNIYLDPILENYFVPFSQRAASKALKTITKGSRIDIKSNTNVIRTFVYWKEPKDERVDIDLSVIIYDEDWTKLEQVAYYNFRSNKFNIYHSGDIICAPDGASEFVDINLESIKENNGRYVVFSLNSYTEQSYKDLPKCFVGWMSRESMSSGQIYEPLTVENKIDVAGNTKIYIPMILDLKLNKFIWTDLSLKFNVDRLNNIDGNIKSIVLIGKAITNLIKPTLYDLFMLHVKARGKLCDDVLKSDIIFSEHMGITPYDIDEIMAEFL